MKKYTLAHNTIDSHDYNHMIDFLKKRKDLPNLKSHKLLKKIFKLLKSKYNLCKLRIISKSFDSSMLEGVI